MKTSNAGKVKNGEHCVVVGGTHKGKSGTVNDMKTSQTGHVTRNPAKWNAAANSQGGGAVYRS